MNRAYNRPAAKGLKCAQLQIYSSLAFKRLNYMPVNNHSKHHKILGDIQREGHCSIICKVFEGPRLICLRFFNSYGRQICDLGSYQFET